METKTAHPEIADAGRRYLEQYGDPLVTNTYLKIALLVMALVVAVMAGVVLKEFKQLANIRPLIIRVDQVGHAEAIDYKNFNYKPQESEAKYYLARWVQLAYQRNKYTILNDLTQSTYFLDNNTADMFIKNEHTGKLITAYQKETLPYVEIEVTNVVLGRPLRSAVHSTDRIHQTQQRPTQRSGHKHREVDSHRQLHIPRHSTQQHDCSQPPWLRNHSLPH
jgi:type IV secretory pathway TrbF-like protein